MVSEYPVILQTNMGSRYSSGGGSALLTDPYLVQCQARALFMVQVGQNHAGGEEAK